MSQQIETQAESDGPNAKSIGPIVDPLYPSRVRLDATSEIRIDERWQTNLSKNDLHCLQWDRW
jgi:hypothetical protein